MPYMIPDNVLEVLESVRQSAITNMLDQRTVIQLVDEQDEEAADWLRSNPDLYMEALNQMSSRSNGGQE